MYTFKVFLCVVYVLFDPSAMVQCWQESAGGKATASPTEPRWPAIMSPEKLLLLWSPEPEPATDQRWQVRQNCYNAATNPRRPLIGRPAPPGPMGGGGRGLLTNGRGVANIWLQFLVVIGWAGRRAAVTRVGSRHQKLSLPTTLAWHGAAAPSRGNHTRHASLWPNTARMEAVSIRARAWNEG